MVNRKWTLVLSKPFIKDAQRLDRSARLRIMEFLEKRVVVLPEPRVLARELSRGRKKLWRFRVGKYRIICEVRRRELIIVGLAIGHRSSVYEDVN